MGLVEDTVRTLKKLLYLVDSGGNRYLKIIHRPWMTSTTNPTMSLMINVMNLFIMSLSGDQPEADGEDYCNEDIIAGVVGSF